MEKHQVLKDEEFLAYNVNSHLIDLIDRYVVEKRLSKSALRILDFGCGRGRSVLKLKLQGFDVYGVDVDAGPLDNAKHLFQEYGLHANDHLFKVDSSCKTSFPDGYFDIVFSQQVVEHVRDINSFFKEIARLTKPGGICYHSFPYKYHFTEQHLFMPIVHWLPKNLLRKLAILFWVAVGREPRWNELQGSTSIQKTKRYYSYSVNKTYYRSNDFFKSLLARLGFRATLRNQKWRISVTNPNSYFPHTTEIVAVKSAIQ